MASVAANRDVGAAAVGAPVAPMAALSWDQGMKATMEMGVAMETMWAAE